MKQEIGQVVDNKDQLLRTVAATLLKEAGRGKGINEALLHQTVDEWLISLDEQQVQG